MFKIGDKVKRTAYDFIGPGGTAREGHVYEVRGVSSCGRWISLMGLYGHDDELPFSTDCFELVKPAPQAAPKFKTGDLVRCLHSSDGRILPDVVYTIADTVEHRVYLKGFAGAYHQDIFQIAEPGLTKSQISGIAGGLQEHSVGEYYPLAAVMYEHKGDRIITIENLQTGEVNGFGLYPCDWGGFEQAYRHIERIAKGYEWSKTKGRVSYASGRWVVAEPANPVQVTRLRNMLHRG